MNKTNIKNIIMCFIVAVLTALLCLTAFATSASSDSFKTVTFLVFDAESYPKTTAAQNTYINRTKDIMYGKNQDASVDPSKVYSTSDSLHSYLYRSSSGFLNVTGNVYLYKVQNVNCTPGALLNEIKNSSLGKSISWDFEAVYFFQPTKDIISGTQTNGADSCSVTIAGENYNIATFGRNSSDDACVYHPAYPTREIIGMIAHETCHMLGVNVDIYKNAGLNENGAIADSIMIAAGANTKSEMPALYKYLYGWIPAKEITPQTTSQTITLRSASEFKSGTTPQLAIVKPSGDNSCFFAVEYLTKKNNSNIDGIRVWVVKTENGLSSLKTSAKNVRQKGMLDYDVELKYIKALSSDSKTNYIVPAGKTLTDATTPNLKIPNSISYTGSISTGDGKATVNSWKNSEIMLTVNSINGSNATITVNYVKSFIKVNPNGGTWNGSTATKTVTGIGGTKTFIDVPKRTGYNFSKWVKSNPFYGKTTYTTVPTDYFFDSASSANGKTSTITAEWTPVNYALKLVDGNGVLLYPKSYYTCEDSVVLPKIPAGYEGAGTNSWYTSKDFTTKTTTLSKGKTGIQYFYAKPLKLNLKVNVNLDDALWTNPDTKVALYKDGKSVQALSYSSTEKAFVKSGSTLAAGTYDVYAYNSKKKMVDTGFDMTITKGNVANTVTLDYYSVDIHSSDGTKVDINTNSENYLKNESLSVSATYASGYKLSYYLNVFTGTTFTTAPKVTENMFIVVYATKK